jgi:hypothetical protein
MRDDVGFEVSGPPNSSCGFRAPSDVIHLDGLSMASLIAACPASPGSARLELRSDAE